MSLRVKTEYTQLAARKTTTKAIATYTLETCTGKPLIRTVIVGRAVLNRMNNPTGGNTIKYHHVKNKPQIRQPRLSFKIPGPIKMPKGSKL